MKEAKKWGRHWETLSPVKEYNALGSYITIVQPEKCTSNEMPLKPQRLMAHLSCCLPDDTRIFVDAGNGWAWATHYLTRSNNQGLYRIAMSFGSMVWSIGAAIGSASANPLAPTHCIVGDGSYLMSAQEITVAAQHQLPVVFIVLNDAAMGMVMHGQKLSKQESIGWELNTINYALLAQAMGIDGIVLETPEQLLNLEFSSLFAKQGRTLIDARIDRNEVPPMGARVKGLAVNGSATPGG